MCINVAHPLTLSPNPSQVFNRASLFFELYTLNSRALHALDSGFDHFFSLGMHYALLNSIPYHDLQHEPTLQIPLGTILCSPRTPSCMILAGIQKGPDKEYLRVVPHILKLLSWTWLRPWDVDYIWTIMHKLHIHDFSKNDSCHTRIMHSFWNAPIRCRRSPRPHWGAFNASTDTFSWIWSGSKSGLQWRIQGATGDHGPLKRWTQFFHT